MRGILTLLVAITTAQEAIAQGSSTPAACKIEKAAITLPATVRETSGLAAGSAGIMWTHNDGDAAILYGLDPSGALRTQLHVKGSSFTDWEDIESAPCGKGLCLYAADIGDNDAARAFVVIHEIAEPMLPATEVAVRRTLQAKYEDGPRDAEALFRTPQGDFYIVTKGRHGPVALYRWHEPASGNIGTLRRVRELSRQPANELDRVSAATISPNGKWVAIRTYRSLTIYQTVDLLNDGAPALSYSLAGLREKQGESLVLRDDGAIWTTSEAEKSKDMPTMAQLTCTMPQ